MGALLCRAPLTGECGRLFAGADAQPVECWLHGSRLDLRSGKPLDPPAPQPVPVYPVRVEDGSVHVEVVLRDGR
jgi:3-phenylpropionate/trans-cinnamate dioxygenase ferredoxin subunit